MDRIFRSEDCCGHNNNNNNNNNDYYYYYYYYYYYLLQLDCQPVAVVIFMYTKHETGYY